MPVIEPPYKPAIGPCEPVRREEPAVMPEEAPEPVELPDVETEPGIPVPYWPVKEPARR